MYLYIYTHDKFFMGVVLLAPPERDIFEFVHFRVVCCCDFEFHILGDIWRDAMSMI